MRIRLLLLQELAAQDSGSWTLTMLVRAIGLRGYRKSEDYLLNQLRWLETEAVAVRLVAAGGETIATLRSAGRKHVERSRLIAGVDKPDDED